MHYLIFEFPLVFYLHILRKLPGSSINDVASEGEEGGSKNGNLRQQEKGWPWGVSKTEENEATSFMDTP